MDNFIVSARKYRPVTFDSVVGQQHITGTLKNAIRNNQLAQAFLFCGPRGVGKTTCARILAKTINCEQQNAQIEACGVCAGCQSFAQGTSFSVHELDAASNNSVEDMRNLIDQVRIPPQQGKYKIYIIDEVHMLSSQAFNAFLKTLEEPPPYAIFILATTEKHKILPTILSRCQIFDFNRIKVEDMADHLEKIAQKEGVDYEYEGLRIIAQKADGGLRDALSMFDQIVSYSNKKVTYQSVIDNLNILDYDYYFRIGDAILAEDSATALLTFSEVLGKGFDGIHFISGLSSHFRDLLVSKEKRLVELLEVGENIRQRYYEQASRFDSGLLLSALNIANHCELNYKNSRNPRLQIELALLKICHIRAAIQLKSGGLDQELVQSEKKKSPDAKLAVTPQPGFVNPVSAAPSEPSSLVQQPVSQSVQEKPTAPVRGANPEDDKKVVTNSTSSWNQVKLGGSLSDLDAALSGVAANANKSDQEVELVTGDGSERIGFDHLLKEWHQIADLFKQENKINLFTLMTANAPRLRDDGFSIEVVVENIVQQDLLLVTKPDIVNALRVKLNNYHLDLIPVKPVDNTTRKPYTAQEKYQAMVAKNPLLDELRQEFKLGLE